LTILCYKIMWDLREEGWRTGMREEGGQGGFDWDG